MLKNAMKIGRLVAFSLLLSAAITSASQQLVDDANYVAGAAKCVAMPEEA